MLGASSGKDSSLKSSSSASYDEASVREDSQGIDDWMEVDDGVDEYFSPPPINLNNEVNNEANPEETPTVATQNEGIHNVQSLYVSAVNNNAVDRTTTTSTMVLRQCRLCERNIMSLNPCCLHRSSARGCRSSIQKLNTVVPNTRWFILPSA